MSEEDCKKCQITPWNIIIIIAVLIMLLSSIVGKALYSRGHASFDCKSIVSQ